MHRRSFLQGAAALAAAPVLPTAVASRPVEVTPPGYRNCVVISRSGTRVFGANGALRATIGALDADWDSEPVTILLLAPPDAV